MKIALTTDGSVIFTEKEKAPTRFLFPIPFLVFIRTIRTQFDADDASDKGGDEPKPAV
jgi:hypothetical protein